MIAILLHGLFVYLLQPPLLYRVYYVRFLAALLAACFGWLASRLSDQGFDRRVKPDANPPPGRGVDPDPDAET